MPSSSRKRGTDEWREFGKDEQVAHLKQRAKDLERDVFVNSMFADEASSAAEAMQQSAEDPAAERIAQQFADATTTYREQALGHAASANEARNRLAVVRAALAAIEGTKLDNADQVPAE